MNASDRARLYRGAHRALTEALEACETREERSPIVRAMAALMAAWKAAADRGAHASQGEPGPSQALTDAWREARGLRLVPPVDASSPDAVDVLSVGGTA